MKPIGPTWEEEQRAAGLAPHQAGSDGLIEVHDQQNRLVKIWKDDAGVVQESRTADIGAHPQVSDAQIAAIKNCLAAHNEASPLSDAAKQTISEKCYDTDKIIKALAFLVMDEINLIRGSSSAAIAAMTDRTEAQLRTAWINKYKSLL